MSESEAKRIDLSTYRGYKGLPPLVDILTMEEAVSCGLTVSESVARLKHLHWALRTAYELLVSRITAEPIYELKMAYSLHAYYCAEHVASFAERVREMRQPPYELEQEAAAPLLLLRAELMAAPTTEAFLTGIYRCFFPHIQHSLNELVRDAHPLFDHPTTRVCRFARLELEEINLYGKKALDCLVSDHETLELQAWIDLLRRAIAAGTSAHDGDAMEGSDLSPMFSAQPAEFDPKPRRDHRFQDSFNMGVNAEAMLFDPTVDALPKTLMLYFKRMREIDVPEMMATFLWESKGKPWGFYREMTRQLWDEARHAMMGEIGFASMGIDWSAIPFNFTWALDLNTKLTPLERRAVLYTIEQGLMPKKNGKEYEWQVAVAAGSPLAALIQDFDWADEILHARIGRDWLVPEIGSQEGALALGDLAWSRTSEDWASWRSDGLTQHRNWWPEVYRQACAFWRIEPDARTLAYNLTYENTRSDQKLIAS